MAPSINVITYKDIARLRDILASPKELEDIVELSVEISAAGNGCSNGLHG